MKLDLSQRNGMQLERFYFQKFAGRFLMAPGVLQVAGKDIAGASAVQVFLPSLIGEVSI